MLLSSQSVLISAIVHAFVLIFAVTLVLNAAVYVFVNPILHFLQIPTCAQQSSMNFGILLVQRLPFPALWSVPRRGASRYVSDSDHLFSGNPCCPRLCAGRPCGRSRHLDCDSYWMVSGGFHWIWVLVLEGEENSRKLGIIKNTLNCICNIN